MVEIEHAELAVTFTVQDKVLGQYRDTIRVPLGTSDEAIQEAAQARFDAWADQIRNPPAPEPAPAASEDDKDAALTQAMEALQTARDVVQDVIDSRAEAGGAELSGDIAEGK